MRILQVCSGTLVNGAIVHALLVTRALARRGHDVTMLCRPGAWIGAQLAADPVDVVCSELRRWPLGDLREAAALVRRRNCEAIQTHMSSAHSFGVLLRWMTGVPCVASAQSRHIQLHWAWNDCVVAASESTRRYHCRYNFVRPSRAVVIHNCVDPARFDRCGPETRAAVRRGWGLDENNLCVLCVADLVPRKGQIYLIEALAPLRQRFPHVRLILVGPAKDPAYAASVAQRTEQLGLSDVVVWAGQQHDLPAVYAAADLGVLPSLEETLPLAVLEAMAARLPVVATAAGGTPECVEHEATGLLVPPADPRRLSEALARLVCDEALRRRFAEAGRRRIEERFSIEHHATALEELFDRLVRQRRAA